jgi:membrane dipeptidase
VTCVNFSSHTLQPHARNVTDDVLHRLKENGGVIMICFLPSFSGLAEGETPSSVATVARHIVYAGQTIGYEHVGIGSDFDGMLKGPKGLDDVSAFPSLVRELLAQGLGEMDIQRVLGLNILRVLDEVGAYAAKQQKNGECLRAADHVAAVWTNAQRDLLMKQGQERGLERWVLS